MQAPRPRTPSFLGFAKHKHPRLWLWDPTQRFSNTNSPVCDSKTTLEGLDHQHLWWLEKATTSTILDLEILQVITLVENIIKFFRYKTLNTKEAHSSLSDKPYKNVFRVSFIKTCCLGLIKILQIQLSIGQACLSIGQTRQIMKSSFCSLYVLESWLESPRALSNNTYRL